MRSLFNCICLITFPIIVYTQTLCPSVQTNCQVIDHSFLPVGQNHKWVDLSNDGLLDLVQMEPTSTGRLVVYQNTGSDFSDNFASTITEGGGNVSILRNYGFGDLNNDRRPDLVVVKRTFGFASTFISLELLLNNGNLSFTNVGLGNFDLSNLGTSSISDPLIGDVDNDGDQDIVFCSDECYLFRNNGNGQFIEDEEFCLNLSFNQTFIPTQLADLNKDGFLDLIGTQSGFVQEELEEEIIVFYDIGFNCSSCHTWENLDLAFVHDIGDYDLDGALDLLVTEKTTEFVVQSTVTIITIKILLNNYPESGFTENEIPLDECTDNIEEAQWADIDNDGDLDLGISQENKNAAIFRNDNGNHVKLFDFSQGFPDKSTIVFGDYNNDNEVDFCGSIQDDGINATYYAEITSCGNNNKPEGPDDLITTTFPGHSDVLLQWDQAEDDQIDASLTYNIEVQNGTVVVSPLSSENQGIRDIVGIGAQSQNRFQRLSGLESGNYDWKVQAIDHSYIGGDWSQEESFSINNCFDLLDLVVRDDIRAETIHVGDLLEESGAYPDILTSNQLIPNEGSFVFGSSRFLERSSPALCRDLNGDNWLDLIYYNDFSISIEINQGNGQYRGVFSVQVGTSQPVVGDIDNDGDRDILFSNGGDNVWIIRNESGGRFILEDFLLYSGDANATRNAVDLYDVDLDGDLDLVSTLTASIQAGFSSFYSLEWLENEGGTFSNSTTIANSLCGPLAIGDMDNDGDKDIVVASSNDCSISIINNSGITLYLNREGVFTMEPMDIYPCPYYFHDVQIGDMDNDGFLDIIGLTEEQNFFDDGSSSGNRLVVLRNDIGSIPGTYACTEVFSRGEVDQFTLGDIDLDKDLDIFYTSCGNTCVHALVNDICIPNTPPSAPSNLTCTEEEDYILLTWESASDAEQADTSLTYQIDVYHQATVDSMIISPESYRIDGQRKVSKFGDQCENLSWRIYGLQEGNYCFRVQAIDHSYVGGTWSQEECCQYELCVDPIPIFCGRDTIGDNGDEELINRISEYFICTDTASGFGMPELIYRITDFAIEQNTHNIFVGLSELGDELAGLDVFVIENCNASPDSELMPVCIDYVIRLDDEPLPMITIPNANPESEYYVIVDSKNTPGDFRLSLSCPGACADSDPLICQEIRNTSTDSGSISISSYYFPDSSQYIDNYAGPDYKVPFTAPRSGNYTFGLDSLEENLDLLILQECNPFMGLAYSRSTQTSSEEIDLFLDSLETVYLVVDAAKGISGDFSLSVNCCHAMESRISYADETEEMTICKTEEIVDTIHLFATPRSMVPYTFLLTDTNDTYISEIGTPFSVQNLSRGKYRIYGVAYENSLVINPKDPVFNVRGDICAILSDNFLSLCIDTTYNISVDTLLCIGESLAVCDTVLNMAGEHQIICQTDGGCDSIIFVNIQFDTLLPVIEGNDFFCAGESTELTVMPIFSSYEWSTGATTQSILVSQADLFHVAVTSENGCMDSVSINVTEVEELLPFIGNDTTLCQGDILILDGGLFDHYRWSSGDTSQSIQVMDDGIYHLSVMDDAGCTGSDTIDISVIQLPVADAGRDTIICDQECVVLRGRGGQSCKWLPTTDFEGSDSCNIQVCPTETTTYELVVFNTLNGEICHDTARVTVTVLTKPDLMLTGDTAICSGQEISLIAGVGDCINCLCLIMTDTGAIETDDCQILTSPLTTTIYNVLTTNENGCSDTGLITVAVGQVPISGISVDQQDLCPGDSVNLSGSGSDKCTWYNDMTEELSNLCNLDNQQPEVTTVYSLVTSITSDILLEPGSITCYDTSTIQINVFDEDTGIDLIEDTVVCSGSTLSLVSSLDCSDCICEWSSNVGFSDPNSCEPSVQVSENAFFIVTATNSNGCSSTDSVDIQVVASSQASTNITDTIICSGDEIILEGTGGSICSWYDDAGTSLSTNCTYRPPTSDDLQIQFVAHNPGIVDCYDTTQINIRTVAPPVIELIADTTICSGENIDLLASSDCSDCICTWSNMTGLDNGDICNPLASPLADISYVLTTTKESVCQIRDTVNVSVIPPVQLTLVNDHTSLRQNNEVTIDLLANDTIIGSQELEISLTRLDEQPRDVDLILNGQELTATVGGAYLGLFDFDYKVRDLRCNEESVGTAEILVIQSDKVCLCNPDIEPEGCGIIPNIGDYGNNDITIFDREGNIVHLARPYMNNWQGIHIQSGERVPTGSYYFVLNLGENTANPSEPEQKEPIRGVITIIRR